MDVTENTLLPLEHRPAELGRIRLGKKAETKAGKEYPVKLEEWRLTSGSQALLEAAAVLYGGTVQPWPDAPDEGYFELFTTSRELRVLIPRTLRTVSQAYELWQGGTCMRRCDGTVEQLTAGPCLCDPGARECEPMTRISLMLPDLPGIGVWRLDTGGWHAATTIPATIELLKQLSTQPWIPAILRLEQRSRKVREADGKVVTHRFAVPALDLPGVTVGRIIARQGGAEPPQLDAGERPAVPTAAERAAQQAARITSGPDSLPAAGPEGGEAVLPPRDEPPHPAMTGGDTAGADVATPMPVVPDEAVAADAEASGFHASPAAQGSGSAAKLPPCTTFDEKLGKCVRDEHDAGTNHRNKLGESWK